MKEFSSDDPAHAVACDLPAAKLSLSTRADPKDWQLPMCIPKVTERARSRFRCDDIHQNATDARTDVSDSERAQQRYFAEDRSVAFMLDPLGQAGLRLLDWGRGLFVRLAEASVERDPLSRTKESDVTVQFGMIPSAGGNKVPLDGG